MIAICPYTLTCLKGGERQGFLLRVGAGFADCHPWQELGDEPIEEQRKKLKLGLTTPLLEQALQNAALDGSARLRGLSLFADREMPKSHLLITLSDLQDINKYKQWGVTHLKLKLKAQEIAHWLRRAGSHEMFWRLDFNAGLTEKQAEQFLQGAKGLKIDLIEDICPFNQELWSCWQNHFKIPLACDFVEAPEWPIRVHKPCTRALTGKAERLIVTSSLGHPVGQLMAAYIATTLPQAKNEVGGWLSHIGYTPTPFSEQLQILDGRLMTPLGTGVGFDALLQELPWIKP